MSTINEPDGERLGTLLREARPAPPLPPRFQESVWRRIEKSEKRATVSPTPLAWLERWVEQLLLPRFAMAGLTLLLVAGGLTGVVTSDSAAKQQAQERYLAAVAPNSLH
ncbi:MAG: hypothetical protein WCO56_07010 [Verrucomicrobiota bacterium]